MADWQFGALRPLSARVVLADPPWKFQRWSDKPNRKSPEHHYATMPTADICAFRVHELAARDCMLWMWATAPMIQDALQVMAAWGFGYKTMGAWAKRSPRNTTWAMGGGHRLRSAAEFFLIGTIGEPRILSKSITNLIVAPRGLHSRKPAVQYETIERMTEGPYCELFARNTRPGWTSWGLEVGKFDATPAAQPLSEKALTDGLTLADV